MKRWLFDPLLIIAVIAILLLIGSLFDPFRPSAEPLLTKANEAYEEGEKAATVKERQKYFRDSLDDYLSLEQTFQPTAGNGKLYYNIASAYYQLQEFPLAILYSYRALALRPREAKIESLLHKSLGKIGLPVEQSAGYHTLLPIHFSVPERIQLFSCVCFLMFIAFSFYLWSDRIFWRHVGVLFSVGTGVLLLSLAYSYYLSPIEGVIVRSTVLYRDAGTQYAPVSDTPEVSGQKVEIIDSRQRGKWLKVETPGGAVGYLASDRIRMI